jgi:hypothetical protein
MPFGISTFGHEFNIDKALKTLSEKDMYSRVTCSLCLDLPRQPMMTDVSPIPFPPPSFPIFSFAQPIQTI